MVSSDTEMVARLFLKSVSFVNKNASAQRYYRLGCWRSSGNSNVFSWCRRCIVAVGNAHLKHITTSVVHHWRKWQNISFFVVVRQLLADLFGSVSRDNYHMSHSPDWERLKTDNLQRRDMTNRNSFVFLSSFSFYFLCLLSIRTSFVLVVSLFCFLLKVDITTTTASALRTSKVTSSASTDDLYEYVGTDCVPLHP